LFINRKCVLDFGRAWIEKAIFEGTEMRLLFSSLIMATVLLVASWKTLAASSDGCMAPVEINSSLPLMGGDAFPLTCPQQFELSTIDGLWETAGYTGGNTAFSFEAQSDCKRREILRIRQFNIVSGAILAEGIGYRLDKLDVRAAMKRTSGGSFLLYVGIYMNKDKSNRKYPLNFVAPVLRMVPFDDQQAGQSYVIQRL
jgi:hypothetical protein